MRALLVLLALSTALAAAPRRIDLGFPQLQERIQVVFPDNHDMSRKWPAVFYYHGTGGKPTTELIRAHTGPDNWFVVGMTYEKGGNLIASAQNIDRERKFFNAARDHLVKNYNLDPKRIYVAGFSKGGWMSGFLLQRDPNLAGGIILGAGHNFVIQKARRFRAPKPIFVGIGRLDATYPFALRALVHFRPLGARTTIETWQGLGHQFPEEGSQALKQWLAIEADPAAEHKPAAEKWVSFRYDVIKGMPDLVDQWVALRELEATPYVRLLGDTWKKKLQDQIAKLEQGGRVAAEARALEEIRGLLRKEMKGHPPEILPGLATAYLQANQTHAGTRQAEIARSDHERIKRLIKHFQEQQKIADEKAREQAEEEDDDPFPRLPTREPVIPRNPLIR